MPKDLSIHVNIGGTEGLKDLIGKLKDLIEQIEINDYKDGLGHELKMNKDYVDFKEFMEGINLKNKTFNDMPELRPNINNSNRG